MKKEIRKAIEDCGWKINSDTSIETWTDTAGQNLVIECGKNEDLVEAIESYSISYDLDYEVEMWLQAKREGAQGIPDVETLVEDCKEAERKYEELWEAVQTALNS